MRSLDGLTRPRRGRARRAAALVAAIPLALAGLVVTAPTASAAPIAPGDGAVFTDPASFDIRADYGSSGEQNQLSLTDPGGASQVVARADGGFGSGTLSYRFDTGCWVFPSPSCRGRQPAPNGVWTISQTGGGTGSSTFVTRIPPAAPAGVTAAAEGPRAVRLSWARGAEPDLVRWTVLEGESVVQDRVGLDACEGATCSTVVRYASDGSGEHTYAVRAHRSTAPGSEDTLVSPSSSTASARLEPAASPVPTDPTAGPTTDPGADPSSAPSDGATGPPGGGAATPGATAGPDGAPSSAPGSAPGSDVGPQAGGGTAAPGGPSGRVTGDIASRRAFAQGFNTFGPPLGIPKLPPLPQAPPPAIAPELGDGTFEGTLGFEDQVLTERVEVAQRGGAGRVTEVVSTALDSERLATSTAGALLLLLAGAHLRRWLSASVET